LYVEESAALELMRAIIAGKMAALIQGYIRGYRSRLLIKELRKHVPILRAAITARTEAALKSAIDGASSIWFEIKLLKDARAILKGLEREKEMHGELEALVQTDPDANFDTYQSLVNEMEMIQRHDKGAFQDSIALKAVKQFKSIKKKEKMLNMI